MLKGTLLTIDLSSGRSERRDIDSRLFADYLGGSGLAAYYAYRNLKPHLDPLDPAQDLFCMAGLFAGTFVPTGCKASFCGRSPLTGIWNESTVGGSFGARLRAAGLHGIVVTGRAPKRSVLLVTEDGAEIHDGSYLEGRDTYETDGLLKKRFGDDAVTASIGPAGEKGSLISSIMVGGHEGRAAGRAGMGALMASKNLKAIVVRGSLRHEYEDVDALRRMVKEANAEIRKAAAGLTKFGTGGLVITNELSGDMPVRNFGSGRWEEGAAKTCGQVILERYFLRQYGCWACPIMCGKVVRNPSKEYPGHETHSPEYETCAGFGSNCLNEDADALIEANDLCNRLGLDTISASGVIAFAMEAYEKGRLTKESCGGLELRWGDGAVMVELVKRIAAREGIGDLLGQGVMRAAAALGGNASEYAIHTKGLEYPYHDPRAFPSMSVNYATANRGACHLEGLTYFVEGGALPAEAVGFEGALDRRVQDGKAGLAVIMQNYMNVLNALGLCKFIIRGKVGPARLVPWLKAAFGAEMTTDDLMRAGERLHTLKRLYNTRLGISRKDDIPPPRLLALDRGGNSAGNFPHLGKLLCEYYALRGWSEDGIPTEERLRDLGIVS
jgi:aldehyde:ferredoxin oxidoreductase